MCIHCTYFPWIKHHSEALDVQFPTLPALFKLGSSISLFVSCDLVLGPTVLLWYWSRVITYTMKSWCTWFIIILLEKGFKSTPTPKSNLTEIKSDVQKFCRNLRLGEFFKSTSRTGYQNERDMHTWISNSKLQKSQANISERRAVETRWCNNYR